MENKIKTVTNKICYAIHPEKIYAYDLGPIVIFLIVWDARITSFEKHRYIRKILRSENLTFDIMVYSTTDFEKIIAKGDYLEKDIVNTGKLVYEKNLDYTYCNTLRIQSY